MARALSNPLTPAPAAERAGAEDFIAGAGAETAAAAGARGGGRRRRWRGRRGDGDRGCRTRRYRGRRRRNLDRRRGGGLRRQIDADSFLLGLHFCRLGRLRRKGTRRHAWNVLSHIRYRCLEARVRAKGCQILFRPESSPRTAHQARRGQRRRAGRNRIALTRLKAPSTTANRRRKGSRNNQTKGNNTTARMARGQQRASSKHQQRNAHSVLHNKRVNLGLVYHRSVLNASG